MLKDVPIFAVFPTKPNDKHVIIKFKEMQQVQVFATTAMNQNFEVLSADCNDNYDCRVLGYDVVQFGTYPSLFGDAYY